MKKITICGSMQFAKQMQNLKTHLEKRGLVVLLPEISESSTSYTKLPKQQKLQQKKTFITNHFNRIRQSDAILVTNYQKNNIQGYIGSNTLMEIAVAHALGKKIFILNNLETQACEEEVNALATRFLEKNSDQPKLTEQDLAAEILEAGDYQKEDDASFEDAVMIGTFAIGADLELL